MGKIHVWKTVPNFHEYEVSEYGEARKGDYLLKPELVHGSGRKRYSLTKNGRTYRFKAHQLVALAFIGPKPFEGAEVCHADGFEHNNHYSNLRWDSRAGNVADYVRHRLQRRESLGRAKRQDYISAATSALLAQASRPKAARQR